MPRSERITVRLSNEELEFIERISRRIGLSKSAAIRAVIHMLMLILHLGLIDVDRFTEALEDAVVRARKRA